MVSVQNSRVKSAHSARRVLCSVVPSLRIQKPYVPHAIATAVHAHVRARQAARFPEARARRTARGFVVRISSKFARRSSLSGYRASLSERCPDLRHVIRTMFGYLRTLNFALRRLRDCVVPSRVALTQDMASKFPMVKTICNTIGTPTLLVLPPRRMGSLSRARGPAKDCVVLRSSDGRLRLLRPKLAPSRASSAPQSPRIKQGSDR